MCTTLRIFHDSSSERLSVTTTDRRASRSLNEMFLSIDMLDLEIKCARRSNLPFEWYPGNIFDFHFKHFYWGRADSNTVLVIPVRRRVTSNLAIRAELDSYQRSTVTSGSTHGNLLLSRLSVCHRVSH